MSLVHRIGFATSKSNLSVLPGSPSKSTVEVLVSTVLPVGSMRRTSYDLVAVSASRLSRESSTLSNADNMSSAYVARMQWSRTKTLGTETRYTSRCMPLMCHMSCPSRYDPSVHLITRTEMLFSPVRTWGVMSNSASMLPPWVYPTHLPLTHT